MCVTARLMYSRPVPSPGLGRDVFPQGTPGSLEKVTLVTAGGRRDVASPGPRPRGRGRLPGRPDHILSAPRASGVRVPRLSKATLWRGLTVRRHVCTQVSSRPRNVCLRVQDGAGGEAGPGDREPASAVSTTVRGRETRPDPRSRTGQPSTASRDSSVQFSSVPQPCPTLCSPTDRSMSGFPVHHHLPELAQTHVHGVSDAIQPSHPLLPPSPPALNLVVCIY